MKLRARIRQKYKNNCQRLLRQHVKWALGYIFDVLSYCESENRGTYSETSCFADTPSMDPPNSLLTPTTGQTISPLSPPFSVKVDRAAIVIRLTNASMSKTCELQSCILLLSPRMRIKRWQLLFRRSHLFQHLEFPYRTLEALLMNTPWY